MMGRHIDMDRIWTTDIGLVTFSPRSLNFSGPKNDCSSSRAKASRTLPGSVEPALRTASTMARHAAVASALWYSGSWPNAARKPLR